MLVPAVTGLVMVGGGRPNYTSILLYCIGILWS